MTPRPSKPAKRAWYRAWPAHARHFDGCRRAALALAAAVAVALAGAPAWAADAVAEALRARVEALRAGHEVRVAGEPIAARRLIPEFYEARGFRPAWVRAGHAEALVRLVAASRDHGLDPNDYHAAALGRHLGDVSATPDAAVRADRDLLLTDALVRLAYHLRFGKANPRELYPDWNFPRALGAIEPVQALESAIAAASLEEAVEQFAPQLAAYRQLRAALARHRAIEAAGGWSRLPPGPTLESGMQDLRIARLRERLAASGDYEGQTTADQDRFDAALEAAVRRFQARHALDPDGVVGRQTLAALNFDVAGRIDQIRVNLERLRWVAQDLAGDYLVVDIAGFSARLYVGDRVAWASRAVVGRPYRKTPVFRATMHYIVLNPAWTVPPTILREDVLPKLAADSRYLEREHMQVVAASGRPLDAAQIDWSRYRAGGFPHQIVQAPGPDNPLGTMKFMLPNPHAVYLHDTPARQLFDKRERAFSSGCIRLEQPLALAVLLLDDAERWSADAIRAAIEAGETRTVPVKRRVPVLVLYFTAEAQDDGTAQFRPDLYGRDPRVLAALRAPFRFSPIDGRRAPRR
ncbi:MAG TPA: L,D-transpeptidase family protein [Burkholderiales bacterium]|nr:L,D-transpeptidase family protein [Burkholderiales bacterium]